MQKKNQVVTTNVSVINFSEHHNNNVVNINNDRGELESNN